MQLSETQKKAIKGYCSEMSASMFRTAAERDLQKNATDIIAKEHELDKKVIRKIASTYHKSNFTTTKLEHEAFETAFESLFGETTGE
jgi:AraC-like DNA-binding protein